jgi:hypothetical protein
LWLPQVAQGDFTGFVPAFDVPTCAQHLALRCATGLGFIQIVLQPHHGIKLA